MTDTMQALVGGTGPSWVLEQVPVPQPGPGEVLVRTAAVAVNNADLGMLDDADPSGGGNGGRFVAGFEYAGQVAALGEDVDAWRVGDLVMGSIPASFAELVVVDQRFVLPRPEGLDPAVACALPTGLLTEHGAFTSATFAVGQSVLVTGASSGIGLIGVQTARALGASLVVGTTRSPDRREVIERAGADVVVVTGEQDLTARVLAATDGRGVDVVLDHVAGDVFAQCLPATAEDGHVVNVGRLAGPASRIDLDALSYRHLTLHGVAFGFTRDEEMAGVIAGLLPDVVPAVARGVIRPVVDLTVGWTEHQQVLERLRSGEAVGKLVMTLST